MQFRHRSIEGFAPRIDDDGPLGAQLTEVEADGLAQAPLDTIAYHRFSNGARHGKPDSRSIGRRFANAESREEGARESGTSVVNPAEIFRAQKADTFRKTKDGVLPFGTDSKFLAAARAPA